jgi:hypothetical protein
MLFVIHSFSFSSYRGLLYYSIMDDMNKIYQVLESTMDGSNQKLLLNSSSYQYESLTIDFDDQRLYYVHPEIGEIYYYDFEQKKTVQVLNTGKEHQLSALTIYQENIYFANNIENTIKSCNKSLCSETTIIRNNTSE